MMITVLSVDSVEAEPEGEASVRRFLTEKTVGARLVEGLAYELPAGRRFQPEPVGARHQVFYVTSGEVSAQYLDKRHDLASGQGVYCEPGEICTLENTSGGPATFYRFLVVPS
jgi:glyoxylate utilization-related uncharacterized protein